MFSNDFANLLFSLLSILAIIPALWVARRFLAVIVPRVKDGQMRLLLVKPAGQLILWLALGTIFLLPLLDILSWLSDLIGLLAGGAAVRTGGDWVYTVLMLILSAVVYLVVLRLGRPLLGEKPWFRTQMEGVGRLEKLFVGLAVASLVSQMMKHVVNQVVLFPIPGQTQLINGGAGSVLLAVGVGIILFVLLAALLYNALPVEEGDTEKRR
jgi:hypothetical protein